MPRIITVLIATVVLVLPASGFAAGSHDNDCTECHSIHDNKGIFSFAVAPNTVEKYTDSGRTVSGSDALCLGCHNEEEGIMPIMLARSHPLGLIPVKAVVPQDVLGGNGELTCVSCHDPHPSNANYMYLRANTDGGKKMGTFCAYCHEAMVDKNEL